jgi:hypothetical protein
MKVSLTAAGVPPLLAVYLRIGIGYRFLMEFMHFCVRSVLFALFLLAAWVLAPRSRRGHRSSPRRMGKHLAIVNAKGDIEWSYEAARAVHDA